MIAGNILGATGSVGLALVYWTIGAIMAVAGFGTYLELASYFLNRSGSEVVSGTSLSTTKVLFPYCFCCAVYYSVV